MPDTDPSERRSSIIRAVTTPLGFFTLVALIVDGLLVALAAGDSVSLWAPLAVLGVLIVGVFVVVLVKPEALGDPSELRPMTVSLQFPIEPIDIQLDTEKCWLVIRDKRGQLGDPVSPNLTFGRGGWVCRLVSVRPTDSVRLELKEVNGRSWRVNPFAPYETTVTAVAVRKGEASD